MSHNTTRPSPREFITARAMQIASGVLMGFGTEGQRTMAMMSKHRPTALGDAVPGCNACGSEDFDLDLEFADETGYQCPECGSNVFYDDITVLDDAIIDAQLSRAPYTWRGNGIVIEGTVSDG